MSRCLVAALMLMSVSFATAEAITYEIYELSGESRDPYLVAMGVREYTLKDIEVYPYQRNGLSIAEKFLELEQGYRIGARIFYESTLTGFGLLANRSPNDFSWEWYSKEDGKRFRKLQGGTYVDIEVADAVGKEELAQVSFVDDTTLRFMTIGSAADTHVIVVKAGSVLRFK